jgi:hypothetical protein
VPSAAESLLGISAVCAQAGDGVHVHEVQDVLAARQPSDINGVARRIASHSHTHVRNCSLQARHDSRREHRATLFLELAERRFRHDFSWFSLAAEEGQLPAFVARAAQQNLRLAAGTRTIQQHATGLR